MTQFNDTDVFKRIKYSMLVQNTIFHVIFYWLRKAKSALMTTYWPSLHFSCTVSRLFSQRQVPIFKALSHSLWTVPECVTKLWSMFWYVVVPSCRCGWSPQWNCIARHIATGMPTDNDRKPVTAHVPPQVQTPKCCYRLRHKTGGGLSRVKNKLCLPEVQV